MTFKGQSQQAHIRELQDRIDAAVRAGQPFEQIDAEIIDASIEPEVRDALRLYYTFLGGRRPNASG